MVCCRWNLLILVLLGSEGVFAGTVGPVFPGNNGRLGGTLGDGVAGPYDQTPDAEDWTFNGIGGFEGLITLAQGSLEHRVLWEYDLGDLDLVPPYTASLIFSLRGPPVFPFPDAAVAVIGFAGDLQESSEDYSDTTVLEGIAIVPPYQELVFTLNVTRTVFEVLEPGRTAVGFRFQIDPNTPHSANQAVMDSADDDDFSKPYLLIDPVARGDIDANGSLDLADYAAFPGCLGDPGEMVEPDCVVFDFDFDGDVDVRDFAGFQSFHSLFSPF